MIAAIALTWIACMGWLCWRMTRRNYWELTRYHPVESLESWRHRWEERMLDQVKKQRAQS